MSETYYSSVDKVIRFTGIRPGDLEGVETDQDLRDLVEDWLLDIKSLIDEYVGRDFAQEERDDPERQVPRAIHNCALRAAKNMFVMSKLARNTGVATFDEFQQSSGPNTTLTNDIRSDLKLFRVTLQDKGTRSPIRMLAMPGRRDRAFDKNDPYAARRRFGG